VTGPRSSVPPGERDGLFSLLRQTTLAAEASPEGLYARLYVEQFSRDGNQRPPYDDGRADVPL
jgi:hypothetical protein